MIETAVKGDLFLDTKLIIPENKLEAIRIMNELHPVVGGQPTHEQDQPNDNNPILDLACTLANIHASGVGAVADLRAIQNKPPEYFFGKGFMSGISSLKGNGLIAVFGQWHDASGCYAIKQFYYTDREVSYRNALDAKNWGRWISILTDESPLDYNKLLNVPITSTLSDDKTKIASIFTVNEVNRKANIAQTTANNADAKAVDAMSEANKKVDPRNVKRYALASNGKYLNGNSEPIQLTPGDFGLGIGSKFLNIENPATALADTFVNFEVMENYNGSGKNSFVFFNGYRKPNSGVAVSNDGGATWSEIAVNYTTYNTTTSADGFLRAYGQKNPITTDKINSDLNVNRTDLVASAKAAYDLNNAVIVANTKAVNAQRTADEKWEKQQTIGSGHIARMSEVDKKHPLNESVFYNLKTGITLNSPPIASGFMQVNDISHNNLPSGFYPYGTLFQGLHKYEGNVAQIYVPHTNRGHILYRGALNHDWNTLALTSDIPKNTASLSENGWWKCATTGVIHQWGTVNYSGNPGETSIWVNFPIAFNNVLNIQLTRKVGAAGRADADGGANIVTLENNRVQVDLQAYGLNSGNLRGVTWYAIGY